MAGAMLPVRLPRLETTNEHCIRSIANCPTNPYPGPESEEKVIHMVKDWEATMVQIGDWYYCRVGSSTIARCTTKIEARCLAAAIRAAASAVIEVSKEAEL